MSMQRRGFFARMLVVVLGAPLAAKLGLRLPAIGSRITPRAGLAPNISFAMGTPEARVFFEPQKTAAMRSARARPRSAAGCAARSRAPFEPDRIQQHGSRSAGH